MHLTKLILLAFFALNLYAKSLTFSGSPENIMHQCNAHILKIAYAKLGIDANFVFYPGERSLRMSNHGQVDGEISRIRHLNKIYKNLLLVPVVINDVQASLFTHRDDLNITQWKDLAPYRLVIIRGAKFIEKNTEGMNRTIVNEFETAFRFLAHQRADIAVVPDRVGALLLKKYQDKGIHKLPIRLSHLKIYHFLHQKNSALVPDITQVLQQMQKSGELKQLRDESYQLLGL